MTTACAMPRANNRAAANRRASNAAMRRRPRGGLVMPQHRIVLDELHHFISRDSLEQDAGYSCAAMSSAQNLATVEDSAPAGSPVHGLRRMWRQRQRQDASRITIIESCGPRQRDTVESP